MKTNPHRRIRGFSLIEVMIAVVVLSFGLLALAALQASLFRAGAETKARANATAIAQQVVENAKTFAFLSAPTGYTGNTYQGLTTAKLNNQTVGGVAYSVCRQVRRYRQDATTKKFVALNDVAATCADTVAVGATFDPGTPEFKEVRVSVAWSGDAGQAKMVELTDSVAAISPADAIQVVKTPFATASGPQVWIVPPNKDNPQVVPIAIGDDQSAASSNPKPQRFEQGTSNAAATLFSVHTFTGNSAGSEVLLNRKLDVAAISCECEQGATAAFKSTVTNPAYQPTVWNGKQLAYMTPLAAPAGTKIGLAKVSNATKDIEAMCTTCCRDHNESNKVPRPDPYRPLAEMQPEHWLGSSAGPTEPGINNIYSEACHLIRVGGKMSLTVDAQQNFLLSTPVKDSGLGYDVSGFSARFSSVVTSYLRAGMESLPGTYLSPGKENGFLKFIPADYEEETADPKNIFNLPPIHLPTPNTKRMVAFGLYVDYISPETRTAYKCASDTSGISQCDGLRGRDPLAVLPFYAVNVANLGVWSAPPLTPNQNTTLWIGTNLSITQVAFNNQGLKTDGDAGVVKANWSPSGTDFDFARLRINNSNSGLAGRQLPVDLDDAKLVNIACASQLFRKVVGTLPPDPLPIACP